MSLTMGARLKIQSLQKQLLEKVSAEVEVEIVDLFEPVVSNAKAAYPHVSIINSNSFNVYIMKSHC